MSVAAGKTQGKLPPAFIGLDTINLPETPALRGRRWLRALQRVSTYRILGAYLQFQNSRHWHDRIGELRDDGWSVGAIYLGYSRVSFARKEKVRGANGEFVTVSHFDEPEKTRWRANMTAANGTRHAQEARALALSAGFRPGSVIWFDNEDGSGLAFTDFELAYYEAFFAELERADPPGAAFRCGFYAHQQIAAQLLIGRPGLHLWEVDYSNIKRSVLPAARTPTRANPLIGLDPTGAGMTLKSFWVVPPSPARPWEVWPVWRQFEGNNQAGIPTRAIGTLTPLVNWDLNASLVRDVTDPIATPRLQAFIAAGTPFVARIDDMDPQWSLTGEISQPRRGRLRLFPVLSPDTALNIQVADGWQLEPQSPLVAVTTKQPPELIALLIGGAPGSTRLTGAGWTPLRPLWDQDIAPALRFPYACHACVLGIDTHLFYVATDGCLWTARRQGTADWGDRQPTGGDLRVHPFATLTSFVHNDVMHVVTYDVQGRLVAVRWHRHAPTWPSAAFEVVGTDVLLPGSALASVATQSGDAIMLVAVGKNLHPRRYVLRAGQPGAVWSAGAPLGGDEPLLFPHTRLALLSTDPDTVLLFATTGNGSPQRYVLPRGNDWQSRASAAVLAPAASPGAAGAAATPGLACQPNPFGDLAAVLAGTSGPLLAYAALAPGHVAAMIVPGAGGQGKPLPP